MNQIVRKSVQQLILQRCRVNSCAVTRAFSDKIDVTDAEKENEDHEKKLSGFAKAFEKFSSPFIEEKKEEEPDLPFATLFRRSKFVEVKFNFLKLIFFVQLDVFLARRSSRKNNCWKNISHCGK